jgi:hypothetical protein
MAAVAVAVPMHLFLASQTAAQAVAVEVQQAVVHNLFKALLEE